MRTRRHHAAMVGRHGTTLAALLAVAACGGDASTASRADWSGRYRGPQVNQPGSCAQPLPAPATSATSYVELPTSQQPFEIGVEVVRSNADARRYVVTPLDTPTGSPVPGLGFTLQVEGDGAQTSTRTITWMEGAREGNHTFHVTQHFSGTGRFERSGGETTLTNAGTFTFTLREGGAAGPVFTTCSWNVTVGMTRVDD